MSDLWPISGVKHFNSNNDNIFDNLDLILDKIFYKFKYKNLRNDLVFISPTKWVEKKIKENHYFKNSYIQTIQTPIPKKNFKYLKNILKRKKFIIVQFYRGHF